jgi:hypothetical protein
LAPICEERYLGGVHRLIQGIAVLLAYAITPGAGELTENVAHYLLDGHAAHGQHEAEEAPNRDTHGCSGPFQTCPCHGTTAFLADSGPVEIGVVEVESQMLRWFVADLQGDGVVASVFRPPIA